MANPRLSPGAQRVDSVEVIHNEFGKTFLALYLNHETGDMSVLVDAFRTGEWNSVYLPTDITDALRKMLNRHHRSEIKRT